MRPPTTSAIEPERRRVHPHERAETEAGQSNRSSCRPMSLAIVGRATMLIPETIFAMRDTNATVEMIRVAFHFEIGGMVDVVVRALEEPLVSVTGSMVEISWRLALDAVGVRRAIESSSMAPGSVCAIVEVVAVDILVVGWKETSSGIN